MPCIGVQSNRSVIMPRIRWTISLVIADDQLNIPCRDLSMCRYTHFSTPDGSFSEQSVMLGITFQGIHAPAQLIVILLSIVIHSMGLIICNNSEEMLLIAYIIADSVTCWVASYILTLFPPEELMSQSSSGIRATQFTNQVNSMKPPRKLCNIRRYCVLSKIFQVLRCPTWPKPVISKHFTAAPLVVGHVSCSEGHKFFGTVYMSNGQCKNATFPYKMRMHQGSSYTSLDERWL